MTTLALPAVVGSALKPLAAVVASPLDDLLLIGGLTDVDLQSARLSDIFLLGPFMIWFGAAAQGVPRWAKWAMMASGVLTITFNARNYRLVSQAGAAASANGGGMGNCLRREDVI
jgi:hypothetical protein